MNKLIKSTLNTIILTSITFAYNDPSILPANKLITQKLELKNTDETYVPLEIDPDIDIDLCSSFIDEKDNKQTCLKRSKTYRNLFEISNNLQAVNPTNAILNSTESVENSKKYILVPQKTTIPMFSKTTIIDINEDLQYPKKSKSPLGIYCDEIMN